MKRINKFLAIICAILLSFSCFACQGETNNSSSSNTSSSVQEPSNSQPQTSGSSEEESQAVTLLNISLSGQQTTANSLAEVSKSVTVTGNFSDNTQRTLSSSEYKVFVEYKSVNQAKVSVIHIGTGISADYTVDLSTKICAHAYTESFTEPTKNLNGSRVYTCSACQDSFTQEIPRLTTANYTLNKVEATYTNEGMDIYSSSVYGTYTIKTADKLTGNSSSTTPSAPKQELSGNLNYEQAQVVEVFKGPSSYPRLLELANGDWLCGFDTWGTGYAAGTIVIVRSTDKGATWSKTVTKASFHDTANCANVALFQLENGDILCGYRALGTNLEDPLSKALHVSISKDNGYTWEKHSTIVDGYNLKSPVNTKWGTPGTLFAKSDVQSKISTEGRLGFFEPHFGYINGELTVMYADDLTTMMENPRGERWANYETQYIIKRTLNGTTWSEAKIVLDGTQQKTVSNKYGYKITDYSRDGMPVFDQLSDGTHVLVVEGTYRDNTKPNRATRTTDDNGNTINIHPFEILLSYSKDGENWSSPVEIYVPYGKGTKASAPYVCVTDDDRLVVSFQTDEDAGRIGDDVSVMKTIISDGTPIENITADNFYEATNPYCAPSGTCFSWNGMMIKNNNLYTISGANHPYPSIMLAKTKIPTNINKVNASTDYDVRNGSYGKLDNGCYKTTAANTLITNPNETLYNGTISVDMLPNTNNDCGLIFRVSNATNSQTYWENESGVSYYLLLVNFEGWILLGKINSGWSCPKNYDLRASYKASNIYNLKVVLQDNSITCYVNGAKVISYRDWESGASGLTGTGIGFRSQNAGVIFGNLTVTPA